MSSLRIWLLIMLSAFMASVTMETSSAGESFECVLVLATRTLAMRSTLIPAMSQLFLNLSATFTEIPSSSALVLEMIQKRFLVSRNSQFLFPRMPSK